ncbi:uncharacterized protein LOC135251785 isoform X3 [Anguilla rostrata]|uniref:uncharacterized protein LOC135251785 isoform X3 n=1 Tax=Anguilla rostrata TaxID=7938 RepID=UPI0030D48468
MNQCALSVSAVPPGGLSRNQSVVLNCEISQVIGSVTLAWLRMKGGRGELVKQEVLSQGHPKKMLSLTLPILSRDQLHWACAVFTESMLRAQVPLHLTLPAPITEPEESKPVLVQYKYFLSGEGQGVSLPAPAETNGTEFIWEWTSHDGSYANARIITIQSNGKHSWNLSKAEESISKNRTYDIILRPKLQNAGVFIFIQTNPEKVKMAQFEVFAVKVEPSNWLRGYKGSDVTMSCEVSHLPDSATLDWERDREPTANTTLIYNNTAHIIIHSADQYSTRGTQHTLYRGSLSSSEVVLICRSPASYRTAYWRWEPSSRTNAIIVASADKHKNASISMEVDKERFSSERYGSNFPLRISPVKFGDSGRYICYFESQLMASVTLVTVQVSAEPPGGLSRNRSVVLNCEISQVIGSVTLAWLRMKGGRGELVKQEVLSEEHPKKMLSLTLPILSRDQLHWACAVFTESMLRAQVPLHLTLPTPEPQGWSTETVVRVMSVVLATLGMLKGLMWYCRRRPASEQTSTGTQ